MRLQPGRSTDRSSPVASRRAGSTSHATGRLPWSTSRRATGACSASLDRNCAPYPEIREPVWEGDSLLFVVEDRGNNRLYRVRADGADPPRPIVAGEPWVTGYDAAQGEVVHTAATPGSPAELYWGDRRLTEVARPFTEAHELALPERFTAVSPDGSEIEAWIMRPLGFEPNQRYPVLLNVHGGPFSQYGSKFFDEFQVYAGAGYAVLYANPRGSSGYSEAWGGRSAVPARRGRAGARSTSRI